MIEDFVIFLRRNIMRKNDQIKLKKRSKEINYSLIKKENKMNELPRIIQRVNKKRRRYEKLLSRLRKRLG